jgi:hypothetical protein
VLFRDESSRIIRLAHKQYDEGGVPRPGSPDAAEKGMPTPAASTVATSTSHGSPMVYRLSVPATPCLSPADAGANFFFTNYSCAGPPTLDSDDCERWLASAYADGRSGDPLRLAIEAAGMAGLANVMHASQMAARAKEAYCRSLVAVKNALNNPETSTADATVMTIMVLGLFEVSYRVIPIYLHPVWPMLKPRRFQFVSFESQCLQSWSTHLDGALTLLQLRGRQQFNSERSGQFLKQAAAQMVSTNTALHLVDATNHV